MPENHPSQMPENHPSQMPENHPSQMPKNHPSQMPKNHPSQMPKNHPPPKFVGIKNVKSMISGRNGLINWGSQPHWSDEHQCWIYCFNYGLGAASGGYLKESHIIVNKINKIQNINPYEKQISNINPYEKRISNINPYKK